MARGLKLSAIPNVLPTFSINHWPLTINHFCEIRDMQVRVHLMIFGRVQGVGFRHYCAQAARQYGLHGWVRNSDDGCVEVTAEGEEASMEPFVRWCRRGPSTASVLSCRESYAPPTGAFDAFEVAF